MARHRALASTVQRGVARWPFAVIGLVVLVIVGWIGWTWLGGVLDRRADAEASGCGSGNDTVRVAVAPSAAGPVLQAANSFNHTKPVVHDKCIRVDVVSADPQTVLDGLTQGWDTSKLGPKPQAWLPDSSLWANRLTGQNASLVGAPPESVATSPVVLAVPQVAYQALFTGNSFQWSELPQLSADPDSWSHYGKPDWGRLTVAIPNPATNPASALAIQSALAGVTTSAEGPVTTQDLSSQPVKNAITALSAAQPTQVPTTTPAALDLLAKATDMKGAPFSAVPVLETDLYRHNLGADGGQTPAQPLYGVTAGGPSPTADFPYLALAGDWVDEAQARASQTFLDYLKQPAQQHLLALAGLRVPSSSDHPLNSPGLRWTPTTKDLVPADANTTQQISAAWANGGQAVTVLVDVSDAMNTTGGDDKSRLRWAQGALDGQVDRSVSGVLGLWEFARELDGAHPYKQLVATGPVDSQRDALHAAVDALKADGSAQIYTSIAAAYTVAAAHYQVGRLNRLVLITASRNDGGTSYSSLRATLQKHLDSSHPLPLDIVAIGSSVDHDELTQIAHDTGGRLSVVKDGADLELAIGQLLSATS